MTLGVIGEKLGMTQVFSEEGIVIPVTVIKVEKLTVTQVKTEDKDGYSAIQVGAVQAKAKHLTKGQQGHLSKNSLPLFRVLKEFRISNPSDYTVGQELELSDFIKEGIKVDVTGRSIGKGFQGTVKRHNFSRGPMSHGSKNHRLPGSIGAGTTPGRVYKGLKMSGNMGNEMVTVKKLMVVKFDTEKNLLLVKGSVPGTEGKLVTVKPSITKWN